MTGGNHKTTADTGIPAYGADRFISDLPRWLRGRHRALADGGRPGGRPAPRWAAVGRHALILAAYLVAGIAVTWPRATYLVDGKLPDTRDGGAYVWGFWWMAHQVAHLANPWFTRSIAAPVGANLGYHALMPLEGALMAPVTVLFGPSASYNLLSILMPGLLCYAMYRAARLWLRSQIGAIAAGAFFGLSSIVTWRAWYQLNLAAGVLFLPLALEAAVRLRRRPGPRQAVVLGVVLAGSVLTDQESAVLVAILAAAALLPWLAVRPNWAKTGPAALAAVVAAALASPQLLAMAAQNRADGLGYPQASLDLDYLHSGAYLPGIFSASPRVLQLGLTALAPITHKGLVSDGVTTYGLVVTVLAVGGLAVSRRRRSAWLLGALWLGSTVLALGATLRIGTHTYVPDAQSWPPARLSGVMPYMWFIRLPGMAGFREASRIALLGMVPAALLAGAGVEWLRRRAESAVVVVAVLAALEAGWSGNPGVGTMPTALPRLDAPIAADHSGSLVVDVPFGLRGGVPLPGQGAAFDPEAEVLATADGHPRAIAFLSRMPSTTLAAMQRIPFYAGLLSAQGEPRAVALAQTRSASYQSLLASARRDVRRLRIGWVIAWAGNRHVRRYLARIGFRFAYAADGARVYRSPRAARPVAVGWHHGQS